MAGAQQPRGAGRLKADPVVTNVQRHRVALLYQVDGDVGGAGVRGHVGQRFLHDPVQHRLHLWVQPSGQVELGLAGEAGTVGEGVDMVA